MLTENPPVDGILQDEHKFFSLITNIYYKKTTWNTNIFIYHYLS